MDVTDNNYFYSFRRDLQDKLKWAILSIQSNIFICTIAYQLALDFLTAEGVNTSWLNHMSGPDMYDNTCSPCLMFC